MPLRAHPDRREMRPPIISAVPILLEFMSHIVPAIHPLQKPPESLILELREIGDRILGRRHGRALVGAHMGVHTLVKSIAGFHRPARSGRGFLIGRDPHGSGQAGGIPVEIKLPPAVPIGKPHLLPDCNQQSGSQRAFPPVRTVRESFPSHGAPSIQLPYHVICPVVF